MAARAISGTRRAFKELVDGTIRVQVDIDPDCRRDFLRLFPDIDTRCAIAPLKPEHVAKEEAGLKGGELARLAGILCGDVEFQAWIEARHPQVAEGAPFETAGPDLAAHIVRSLCQVQSRAELDHDKAAAARFHELIRKPWSERTQP